MVDTVMSRDPIKPGFGRNSLSHAMKIEALGTFQRRATVLVRKQTKAALASDWKRKTIALYIGDPRAAVALPTPSSAAAPSGVSAVLVCWSHDS